MTTDQEMRQLADQATEGPWEDYQDDLTNDWEVVHDQEQRWLIAEVGGGDWNAKNDAKFIAACREWVPDALKRLEAARELQAKIARHAQQDREEGLPATALLTQIANDLNRALEEK